MSSDQKKILHTFHDRTFIQVVDKGEFRYLFFRDSIVQSKIMRKQPHRLMLRYTQYMMAASLLCNPKPSRVLLVGIGAGALLQFFHHYLPQTQVDGVDYSEHILKVARGYFSLPENDKITIFCNDGLRFLKEEEQQRKYDLILMDAFNDNGMAKSIYSHEFLRLAKNRLNPGGIIVCNLWSGNEKAYERVKKAIKKNSTESIFIPVRKRENITSLLFQEKVPWQRLSPSGTELKDLAYRFNLDFAEVANSAKKNNLKLGDRVQLWLH